MAKLYINGLIGSKSNEELELAFEYLNKAISLGNIAAINTLGLMYQNGTYHVKKNIKKAIGLFEQVTNKDYPYAYNNLGLIYEAKGNIQKSFKFFYIIFISRRKYRISKIYINLYSSRYTKCNFKCIY